jgi:NAD(P)-dependent dehydrogenase (short-subunit alcohol dehydrogenase family)
MSRSEWEEIVSINLTGSFLVAREAARAMRGRGQGRIVLVGSVSGRPRFEKFAGFAAYAASKAGLTGLIEVLAVELRGSGVGAAMVCPGGVETEMFARTFPGSRAPLSAERVASAILDLADPRTALPRNVLDLIE